jgi:hypothetical protein
LIFESVFENFCFHHAAVVSTDMSSVWFHFLSAGLPLDQYYAPSLFIGSLLIIATDVC